MKRSALHGLGLGLEDETEVEETEEVVPSETADETPADEVIEVTEAAEVVEDTTEVVEELQEQEAALESLKIALESCIADGGMDQKSAVFFNLAYSQVTDRLGLKPQTVSTESFGGTTSRLNATNISLESIGETLKKIWLAIKNAVMRAMKAIADFFSKIFGGVGRLKTQAEALIAATKDMKEDASKEVTIRSAGKLQINGKFDAASVETGMSNLHKVLDGLLKTQPTLAKETMDVAASFFGKQPKDEAEVDAANAAVDAGEAKVGEEVKKDEASLGKLVISGNYRVVLKDAKAPQLGLKIIGGDVVDKKFEESQKIKALSGEQIKAICGNVIDIAKLLESKKSVIEGMKKDREAAQKTIDAGVAAMSKENKPGFYNKLKTNVALRAYRNDMTSVIAQATSHAFSASRSALVLAEKSIAVQKGEKKADDKK